MIKWQEHRGVQVTARNSKNGDTLELIFGILDTDIAYRWIQLINENNDNYHTLRYNYKRILNLKEIEEKFQAFKTNIHYINYNYDRKLPDLTTVEELRSNQSILNDLHEEYEIYGDRLEELIKIGYYNDPISFTDFYAIPWPGKTQNMILHESFLTLNEQIHNFEGIFRNWDTPKDTLCACLVDYMPAGIHDPLQPEDYFLFEPIKEWGWIYLGYNTLGKHWLSTLNDNDVEVVKRKAIRPQKRFAAEFTMHFAEAGEPHGARISFYNWWMKNKFSEVIDPQMKLEELAFGYIPIGRLYAYKINSTSWFRRAKLKYATEITNKHKWNSDVWSKFDTITDIKIIYR